MPALPIKPRSRHYRGSNPALARKAADHQLIASRIAEHLNRLIANNQSEVQQYSWAEIANALSVSISEVRASVWIGGNNGVTLRVTPELRQELACYIVS